MNKRLDIMQQANSSIERADSEQHESRRRHQPTNLERPTPSALLSRPRIQEDSDAG